MLLSAFLQVLSFLCYGISFGACQVKIPSHVLVYERQKFNIFGNLTNDSFKNYICIGTNVHFLWVAVHETCFKTINSAKLAYSVLMMGDGKVNDIKKLDPYEVTDVITSGGLNAAFAGLILFRLQFPIQLIGSVKIGNVARNPVSKATECTMLTWNLEASSAKQTALKLKIWKVFANSSSKNDPGYHPSKKRISVFTNSTLCEALRGSVLSCRENFVQGLAGILTEKSCNGENMQISFVDLGAFRIFFRDLIEDWEWTQGTRQFPSCAETVGYTTSALVLTFLNVF